jgi:hypothetical protein
MIHAILALVLELGLVLLVFVELLLTNVLLTD